MICDSMFLGLFVNGRYHTACRYSGPMVWKSASVNVLKICYYGRQWDLIWCNDTCGARMSWAQVPAFAGYSARDRKITLKEKYYFRSGFLTPENTENVVLYKIYSGSSHIGFCAHQSPWPWDYTILYAVILKIIMPIPNTMSNCK